MTTDPLMLFFSATRVNPTANVQRTNRKHLVNVLGFDCVKTVVDSARERKVAVTAICGYSFVPRPTKDIEALEMCEECIAFDAALNDLMNVETESDSN